MRIITVSSLKNILPAILTYSPVEGAGSELLTGNKLLDEVIDR